MLRDDERPDDACDACTLPASRRDFIRDVSLVIAGALASAGVSRRAAAEFPVSAIEALGSGNTSKPTYPLPTADGAQIDRKNEVIVVRWEKSVYAFNLSCPHQHTALRWNDSDRRFKCPKHNSRYQPDGTFIDGRATRGMDRFSVALEGSNVVVNVDAMHKQDTDPAGWSAAVIHLP